MIALSDVIHKNVYMFFSGPDSKNAKQDTLKTLKQSSILKKQMFLSLKCRPNPDKSIDEFMSHENTWHSSPLADLGAVRPGVKFDVLDCLQAPKWTHDVTK